MYGNLIHRRAMEKFRPPTQANEILCSLARLNGTFYTSSFSFDGLYAIPSGNHVSQITTGEYQTRLFMPGSWRYKDQDISLRNPAAILAVFVSAIPTDGIKDSCNTGPVQCCNDVHKISSREASSIYTHFGVDVPVGTNVGFKCSPITAIGAGSGSRCQSQPVCCENNDFNGVVVIGCSPVNVFL